jgi:hypothetical protein
MRTIYRLIFYFLIMVSPIFLRAQSERLIVSKTAQCFLNKRNNQFLVFDDSINYYSIPANGKKWTKHHFTFLSTDLDLEQFKDKFKPISLQNGSILFVYNGVGEVYELKDDTLQRIDHSFKHENQFGHALFEYQNKIYAFGGYGLFTFKNILTYFNLTNKEWYELTASKKPEPRTGAFYQLTHDKLFVFAGLSIEGRNVTNFNDCWEFSFASNQWRKLGQMITSVFLNSLANGAVIAEKPLDIIVSFPDIWLVDIYNNQLTHYKNKLAPTIREAYFDRGKQHVLLVNHQNQELSIQVTNANQLFQEKMNVIPFYEARTTPTAFVYLIAITLFFLLGFIILIFFRFKKKKHVKVSESKFKKIRLHNNQLFIGERLINNDVSLLEYRILMKFIEHKNEPIDIVALNELFEDETTSLAAQKKRRETTLKSLREKLAFFLNTSQEHVFLESRDLTDKRIKKFVINPDILAH